MDSYDLPLGLVFEFDDLLFEDAYSPTFKHEITPQNSYDNVYLLASEWMKRDFELLRLTY